MKTVLLDAAEICVVTGYLVAIFMVTSTAENSTENCGRRGVYSWQRRSHHLCYYTNWTKVASLSSHPRNCVRASNSGPQPVVALIPHSSVAYWSILITGSLLLTCIPILHQIMARKFRSLVMIYFLSVQFSVPYPPAAKGIFFPHGD
jgi:hypothetical protein